MTSFGDISGLLKSTNQVSSGSSLASSVISEATGGSSIAQLLSGEGLTGAGPLAELGIMTNFNDPLTAGLMFTPLGPTLGVMQMLGLPPIGELFKSLGVDKILNKIPGVGTALNLAKDIGGGIVKGAVGIGKKVAGGISKVAKKL